MLRRLLLLSVWALSLCAADGQPVSCTGEEQCSEGYYCETEAKVHICKECLSCNDLKREAPLIPTDCVKSVAQCGACFKGLVVDRLSDVNSACVVSGSEEAAGTPHYVWWLVGILVLIFLALVIGIIVYISLNPGIFENFKFGGNCQTGTVSTNIRTEARPSAPEAPPPYSPGHYNDIPYNPVRTTESPCPPQHDTERANGVYVEEEGPFIKRNSTAPPPGPREAAGSQAANVFNLPIYERQDLPNSDTPTVTELNDNLAIHDEETMESPWTPTGPSNGDINADVSSASAAASGGGAAGAGEPGAAPLGALLAAARDHALVEHTPPKQICIRPPSINRNRDSNPGGDGNQGNFSGSHNGPPYNFITQITNVVQFNRTT